MYIILCVYGTLSSLKYVKTRGRDPKYIKTRGRDPKYYPLRRSARRQAKAGVLQKVFSSVE